MNIGANEWVLGWHPTNRLSAIMKQIHKLWSSFRSFIRFLPGKGDRVDFWADTWLLDMPLKQKFSRLFRVVSQPEMTIQSLLSNRQGRNFNWSSVFRRELNEEEACELSNLDQALSTYFFDLQQPDKLIWTPSINGDFTSKSAYIAITQLHQPQPHNASWAWKLHLPRKVKFFLWSALHQKLLTRSQQSQRGMGLDTLLCPLCNEEVETTQHVLMECSYTRQIWDFFLTLLRINVVLSTDLHSRIEQLRGLTGTKRGRLMMEAIAGFVPWSAWEERNKRVFTNKTTCSNSLSEMNFQRIISWLGTQKEFSEFNAENLRASWTVIAGLGIPKQTPTQIPWNPPDPGVLKLNTDGSSLGNLGPAGIGGVIRSHDGSIVLSFAGPLGIKDSTEAEACAVLKVLQLFDMKCRGPLQLEGDCSNVIKWCKEETQPPWRLIVIFREIWELAKTTNCSWNHVPRSANFAADELAKEGVSLPHLEVREPP